MKIMVQILNKDFSYFRFIIYFYKNIIFSSLKEIASIFLYYLLGSILFIFSLKQVSLLFNNLMADDINIFQVEIFNLEINLDFTYFIVSLFFITSTSFLLFYLTSRKTILYSGSIIKNLTKMYNNNQESLNVYLKKKFNIKNDISLASDLNIMMRLTRLSISNIFDSLIIIVLTVITLITNIHLFLILLFLLLILFLFQINISKRAFNYQELFKKSFIDLRKNIQNGKVTNITLSKYIRNSINRLLIIEKSRSYSNFFFIVVVISFALYLKDIRINENILTLYSIFILIGIRIYYISCKNIFSYFTSINRFYLTTRKIIILISYVKKDYDYLDHTFKSIKSLDVINQNFDDHEV